MKYKEDEGYYVNRHSCFLLQYHLVLVTKYRRPVIDGDLKEALYSHIRKFMEDRGMNVIEINGEADHVHVLFEAPPQINLATFVNNVKTSSSRRMRTDYKEQVDKYYWKPYFWSLSYFLATVSDRSKEAVRKYIQNQNIGKN